MSSQPRVPLKKLQAQPVCMGCSATMATPLFCFSCHSIQRLNSRPNYFELFGLPYRYEIPKEKLERIYLHLTTELHPDFYAARSDFERRQSLESSSMLNQAYETLRQPMARAAYLLQLLAHGEKLNERALPPGFLEEMFELQETLDELLLDPSQSERFNTIKMEIEARRQQIEHESRELFERLAQTPPPYPELLQAIQTHLNTDRYLQRLLERFSPKARTL